MDAASQAASSANAVNRVLQVATQAAMDQAEKLLKATVEMAVNLELGKGKNFDEFA